MNVAKNYRTTVAALVVAVAAVLASGVVAEFSPGAQKWFHLSAALATAVGLVLAKDASTAPAPAPAKDPASPPA